MTAYVVSSRHFFTQYLFIFLFLSLNSYAASEPTALERALVAMRAGDWQAAVEILEENGKDLMDPHEHYSLAICYSRSLNLERTLSHALHALTGVTALEQIYADGARELVLWAGVESARREDNIPNPLLDPTKMSATDVSLEKKEAEAERFKATELKNLIARAKLYVDIDYEISKAKFDVCWHETPECLIKYVEASETGIPYISQFAPPTTPLVD